MSLKTNIPSDELSRRLIEEIPIVMNDKRIPGVSIALIRDSECIFAAGFGVTDTHTGEPVTAETIFEAYSCTKPLVAYRALKMCEEGVLELDRPLNDYLIKSYISNDPRIAQITLRMIVSHTSGLPDDENERQIGFTPGIRWSYSTVGFYYLQHVMDQISGLPFEQNMQENVLKPFSMDASSFVWQDRFLPNMAHGHDKQCSSQEIRRITVGDADSLLTTPSDYAKFMIQIIKSCRIDKLHPSKHSVSQMVSKHISISEKLSWGLGWGIQQTDAGDCFWQFGGGEGAPFQNFAVAFRDLGIGVIILTNSANGEDIFEDLVTLAIGGEYPVFPWPQFIETHFEKS